MVINNVELSGAPLLYAYALTLGWKFGTPRLIGEGSSAMYLFPLSRPEWDTLGAATCYADTKQWVGNVPRWDRDLEHVGPSIARLARDGISVLTCTNDSESQVTLVMGAKVATAEAETLPVAFMRACVRFYIGDRVQVPKELV